MAGRHNRHSFNKLQVNASESSEWGDLTEDDNKHQDKTKIIWFYPAT